MVNNKRNLERGRSVIIFEVVYTCNVPIPETQSSIEEYKETEVPLLSFRFLDGASSHSLACRSEILV